MAKFQILALDGGGVRGLYSAAVLAKLEERHDVNITDHFDLITGTSTGGIIALGMGLGMRPREIVHLYANVGSEVFCNPLKLRNISHWIFRKYSSNKLQEILSGSEAFGDKKLGESRSRLVIPTYNLQLGKVRVFKTPHNERLKSDWRVPAWKIAMATSAAPTYFPVADQVEDYRLIDGGVWANNPTVVGIAEAVEMFDCKLEDISVLNLGTTNDKVKRRKFLNWGGIIPWVHKGTLIDILMRAQSNGYEGLAQYLVGKQNVLRIDPIVPETVRLDRPSERELLSEAEDTVLHLGPEINNRFFSHKAAMYTPLYPNKKEEN